MEEVVKAIEKLSEKNIVDYLLVIGPIVISVMAIIISIVVALKQNRIALFNMRYKALVTIKSILRFDSVIDAAGGRADVIIEAFNMCFQTHIDPKDKVKAMVETGTMISIMDERICVLAKIFKKHDAELLEKTMASLSEFMCNAINQEIDLEEQKRLHFLCELLRKITFEKLENYIRV